MGVVEVCPKNQVDITTASKKLGCKNDTYGNNRYMCVPKEDKASLFEFCYDGNMGIEEGGACLEASFGGIRRYNCSGFMYGCPDVPFHRYDVHKYPACQDINTKQRCYVLDRSCSSHRIDQRIEKELKEEGSSDIIIYAAIGVFLFIVVILAAIFIRKFFLKKAPVQSDRNGDGIYEHVTERQEHLDASARLLPDHGSAAHATRPLPNPNNEAHATRPLPSPYNEAQSTIQVPFYNNEVSSTGPVSFNNNEGNAHRLNESVSPNTPFSAPMEMNQSVLSRTPCADNSMQKGAIHSCNEFGTLYKDETIACYEAEEKQKGMKVSIRFKENKADQKEQPEEILNKNADMFRLKRDGKLATFKLLYEEDEEQNNDPSTEIKMEPADEGHSEKPFGNGVG